ncbi:SDR family oxidoreductase [Candidatus Pelagibacter sp.]|jgi:NAD(P)-dependent dehydrogenase (short-subunit alcohol dehydrogenase family)|nr:SDR family oxidoreductase [Candidatus Pelagibacter sp.]
MLKKFSLKNKNVIITGAAGLLGLQHIYAVLHNSGDVVLIDNNKSKLNKRYKELITKFDLKRIKIFCGDITNEKFVKNVSKKILDQKRTIDVLINNAAIDYKVDLKHKKILKKTQLENFDLNIWKKDLDVGLMGALICTKIFGSQMAKKKGGVILNIASDLSFISPDNRIYNHKNQKINIVKPVSYSVVKHGIVGLTRYTATYWSKQKVRCNAIAPGGIKNNQPKNFLNKVSKLIPMNRLANHGEYISSILYLITDASSYTNGAVLNVDGGRTVL